jgi:hypothetical protein
MSDTVNAFLAVERAEPIMDKRGQRYVVKGEPRTRVTTFIDAVKNGYHIAKWREHMVAIGVAENRSLQLEVAACRDEWLKLDAVCGKAIERAKGTEGSSIGTSLHDLTEMIDRGATVSVPEPWATDLDAYRRTLADAGIEIVAEWIEGFVVHHELKVAGRYDRFVRAPGIEGLVAFDLKTGQRLYPTEHATQLALYANAPEQWDPTTDTTSPMPDDINKDVGIICHLPEGQGTCSLHVVDIRAGWDAVQLAASVRRWQARTDLMQPYDPSAGTATKRAYLLRRVERLRDAAPDALGILAAQWPTEVPTFKQSDTHSDLELSAIQVAVEGVESRYRLAFVPTDAAEGLVYLDAERMVARLQALPPDLLAVVEAAAREGSIPNLRSSAVRREHLDALEQVLGPVEMEHEQRRYDVQTVLAEAVAPDDHELVTALAAHVSDGRGIDRLTEGDVARLREMCDQLNRGDVVFVAVDDGWIIQAKQGAA